MRRKRLDDETAARLLRGAVDPGDAPPGYAGVARLLRAASGTAAGLDRDRGAETVAAMAAVATNTDTTLRRSAMKPRFRAKLAAAAAAGAFSVAGVAAAATGSISGPLHAIGAAFHGDGRTVADESAPKPTTTTIAGAPRNHGACVSMVAHEEFATSTDHGEAVSEAAQSDCGKKPKGEHGRSGEHRPGTTTSSTVAEHEQPEAEHHQDADHHEDENRPGPTTSTTRPGGDDRGEQHEGEHHDGEHHDGDHGGRH